MKNRLVVDVECASLAATVDADIPLHCVGLRSSSFYHSLPGKEGVEELQKLIDSDEYRLVFHNASFDVAVLRTQGVTIPKGCYDDTMLMAYCLKPMFSQFNSLSVWGQRFGKPKVDYLKELIGAGLLPSDASKSEAFKLGFNPVMELYNLRDLDITWLLYDWCLHQFTLDSRVSGAYYDIELPYVEVVMAMEANGMFVDTEQLRALGDELNGRLIPLDLELERVGGLVPSSIKWVNNSPVVVPKAYKNGEYKRLGETVYDHCGLIPFNPQSGTHISWVLLAKGWKPTEYTKGGCPVTSANILEPLEKEHPIIAVLSERSKLNKLIGTFIKPVLIKAKDQDGYINTSYNQCTTKTTRLSSSNPNLQNIPTRTPDGKRIRRCFTAPTGYSLVIGDLSSIEVRILAVLLDFVGDSRVSDSIRAGDDIHAINQAAWGMDSRSPTKNGFFALVYGAWLNRFALTIDKPVPVAKKFFNIIREDYKVLFETLMPKVWKWARKKRGYYVYTESGRKSRYGFVYGLLGHRYHYENITSLDAGLLSAAKRECFNAVIQGTGAGLFKLLTLRGLGTSRVDIFPCAVVHDELICLIKDEDAIEGAAHLTKVFSEYVLSGVPIAATFNIVDNWSLK